jgi:hypothetical protein
MTSFDTQPPTNLVLPVSIWQTTFRIDSEMINHFRTFSVGLLMHGNGSIKVSARRKTSVVLRSVVD